MMEDRKKFAKQGSKELSVEVLGFDPSKIDESQYHSQQPSIKKETLIKNSKSKSPSRPKL